MLSQSEQKILLALAKIIIPKSLLFDEANIETIIRFSKWLETLSINNVLAFKALINIIEFAPFPHRFSELNPKKAISFVEKLSESNNFINRNLFYALCAALKKVHFDKEELFNSVNAKYHKLNVIETPAKWMSQVLDGKTLGCTTIDCDVVVIGTGAGGAACAYELAKNGKAVLLLEMGQQPPAKAGGLFRKE